MAEDGVRPATDLGEWGMEVRMTTILTLNDADENPTDDDDDGDDDGAPVRAIQFGY